MTEVKDPPLSSGPDSRILRTEVYWPHVSPSILRDLHLDTTHHLFLLMNDRIIITFGGPLTADKKWDNENTVHGSDFLGDLLHNWWYSLHPSSHCLLPYGDRRLLAYKKRAYSWGWAHVGWWDMGERWVVRGTIWAQLTNFFLHNMLIGGSH